MPISCEKKTKNESIDIGEHQETVNRIYWQNVHYEHVVLAVTIYSSG